MGAGGTFLRVLATGTLAVVMAAVPPPPDHHGPSPRLTDPEDPYCDVPEVTVVDGQPAHIASGTEWQPMTLYLHASEMFDALRIKFSSELGEGVMWVPFSGDCMNETDGWYEVMIGCKRWEIIEFVSFVYKVKDCRNYCMMDLRHSAPISFTVIVYGHSLWRFSAPPPGCHFHKVIDVVYTGNMKCHDNPFATSTSTKGTSPPNTGTPPPTTGAPPPTTSATPLTLAAPYRNSSGVEVQVAAVVQEG